MDYRRVRLDAGIPDGKLLKQSYKKLWAWVLVRKNARFILKRKGRVFCRILYGVQEKVVKKDARVWGPCNGRGGCG